jgi:hypothetical protein
MRVNATVKTFAGFLMWLLILVWNLLIKDAGGTGIII